MKTILITLLVSLIGTMLIAVLEYYFGVVNVFITSTIIVLICGIILPIIQVIGYLKTKFN